MDTTTHNSSHLVDINDWLLNGHSLHDLLSDKSEETAKTRADVVVKFEYDSACIYSEISDETIDRVASKLKNIDYSLRYASTNAIDDLAINHINSARYNEHHMMRGEVIEALLAYEYACIIRNKANIIKNGRIEAIDLLKTDDKLFDVAYTAALSSCFERDEIANSEFLRQKFYFSKLSVSEIVKILDTYVRIMIAEFDKTDPIHYTLVNGSWKLDGGIVERDEHNQFLYDVEGDEDDE